jgi:hypothetical protein
MITTNYSCRISAEYVPKLSLAEVLSQHAARR